MKTIEFSLKVARRAGEVINSDYYLKNELIQITSQTYFFEDEEAWGAIECELREADIDSEEYKIY